MLIRGATLDDGAVIDVRIEGGRIAAIGSLVPLRDEPTIEARGGYLLPGLHDHHVHVAALAASLNSVQCGPPHVNDADALAQALQRPGIEWIRGTGYHESVAGMLDTATLDNMVSARPVRIQHRSGRMWFFNSAGLDRVLASGAPSPRLEREHGRYTGRLFDDDRWLQGALGSEPPSFTSVGALLARHGVTGVTEMSPANDAKMATHFSTETQSGALPQHVLLAGKLELEPRNCSERVHLGPAKLHLHEAQLPALDDAVEFIRQTHGRNRVVAIHCATEVELMFALGALRDAGAIRGDRIEHASVAPDHAIDAIAQMGIHIVSQPHFIYERGDAYLQDVDAEARKILYRLRSFLDAGVTLAAGSDAPFGGYDPWLSMASAVSRASRAGKVMGAAEALTPEQALDLYLRAPEALHERRTIKVGVRADLCLLDRSWSEARESLSSRHVRATFIDGRLIFDRIDHSPT